MENQIEYEVLIVEDDPMVAMINGQYVSKNPLFKVCQTVRNGQEALDYLENNSVDLIVLDVFMPYMDGIETLKKIRERKISSEVIMVTAANDSATIEETMHLGVIDYLIKPFAYERFQVALEKFVSHRNVLKENCLLDQKSLDKMISARLASSVSLSDTSMAAAGSLPSEKNADQSQENLPKGIQKKTLMMIKDFISENALWFTVSTISDKLGISIVTARHYLAYLEDNGFILSEINYNTGGRPSVLYKKVK